MDIEFLVKGKSCFCAGGDYKEVGVDGKDRLNSTFINHHIYCFPSF